MHSTLSIINCIYDVYSNRKNKGTHKAVKRLKQWMRKPEAIYFIQLDIKNFFYSVKQSILLELINKGLNKAIKQQKVSTEKAAFLLWLSRIFITADYQNTTELDKKLSAKVPLHKQLKQQPKGQGLPIGNLTSQFFANIYLNELDQHIKHTLKCSFYLRYADDFILLAKTENQLIQWQQKINEFLSKSLNLNLKKVVAPQPVNNGANFLGFIIRPYYVLVRRRVINNLTEKLNIYAKELSAHFMPKIGVGVGSEFKSGFISDSTINIELMLLNTIDSDPYIRLEPEKIAALRSVLASYLGHFKHANSLKLVRSIWRKYPWLNLFFTFNPNVWALEVKYQSPMHYNFKQQIHFFRAQYPQAYLTVQKGKKNITFKPWSVGFKSIIKKVVIKQTGFNTLGIQQRDVCRILLNSMESFSNETTTCY